MPRPSHGFAEAEATAEDGCAAPIHQASSLLLVPPNQTPPNPNNRVDLKGVGDSCRVDIMQV